MSRKISKQTEVKDSLPVQEGCVAGSVGNWAYWRVKVLGGLVFSQFHI